MSKKEIQSNVKYVIKQILVYAFCIGIIVAAVLFSMDKSTDKSIFGFRFYTVLTPSMEPTYNVGDLVIVKLANADEINIDDVITFNPSSDSDAYLTHRVVEKYENYENSGVTCFRTKGDANDSEDAFLLDSERVIGTVKLGIPKLGYIAKFIQLRWYVVIPLFIMVIVLIHLIKILIRGNKNSDKEVVSEEQDNLLQNSDVIAE
jgi:signal peptidase